MTPIRDVLHMSPFEQGQGFKRTKTFRAKGQFGLATLLVATVEASLFLLANTIPIPIDGWIDSGLGSGKIFCYGVPFQFRFVVKWQYRTGIKERYSESEIIEWGSSELPPSAKFRWWAAMANFVIGIGIGVIIAWFVENLFYQKSVPRELLNGGSHVFANWLHWIKCRNIPIKLIAFICIQAGCIVALIGIWTVTFHFLFPI